MSIVVNGIVIPNNDDFIIANNTILTKVKSFHNNIETTVWEKLLAVDADPSQVPGVSVGTYSFYTGDWDVYISRSLSSCISGIDASLYKGLRYYVSASNSRQNHRGCTTRSGLSASCTNSTQLVEQCVDYHSIGWDEEEDEWSLKYQTLTLSWENIFTSGTVNISIGCLGDDGHGQSYVTITNCILLAR